MSLFDEVRFRTTKGYLTYIVREDLFDMDDSDYPEGSVIEVEDWFTEEYVTLQMTDCGEWSEINRTTW